MYLLLYTYERKTIYLLLSYKLIVLSTKAFSLCFLFCNLIIQKSKLTEVNQQDFLCLLPNFEVLCLLLRFLVCR